MNLNKYFPKDVSLIINQYLKSFQHTYTIFSTGYTSNLIEDLDELECHSIPVEQLEGLEDKDLLFVQSSKDCFYNFDYDFVDEFRKKIDRDLTNYMCVAMHFYHILISKNMGLYDWLHHIVFVGTGVLPGMLYVNSNQLYLHKIACIGIPGIIEYGSLTLYKNNKLTKINQKFINTILYVYFRLPLCILGVTMNYLAYKDGLIKDPLWITLYVNLLLYVNGVVFTYLTFDSYGRTKYLEIK